MAKIYSKKKNATPKMLPKKETVNFILNYSKALRIEKLGNVVYETILN
ncbi:hypothetical protein [Flavobacterium sp.]|nr:hypothetical protein [Flavobacterium sp.]